MTLFGAGIAPGIVAFVGNGPLGPGAAGRIDGADWVVRFNRARGFGGPAGRRLDDLVLVNVGGQALEWVEDPTFLARPHVAAARRVTLPVWNSDAGSGRAAVARGCGLDGINFEADLRDLLSQAGRRVVTIPEGVRRGAVDVVAGEGFWPSTGALALFWYDLMAGPETRFDLHGFTFEGAAMHDWTRERAWAEGLARSGRARIFHAYPS